jgi:nucleotidyltransferase/DNA polymerase involved in DNA repair
VSPALRVLCTRYPHLALVAAWSNHPELRHEPVVVGGAAELRLPVLAASAAAQAAGVRPGQPLREAQQRCPAAAFVAADETAIARLRETLLGRLCRLAPIVEVGDEVAYCDLSGRHAAHAEESGWAIAVARSVTDLLDDDDVAVGVASSRLVAGVAAGRAGSRRIRRIAPGEEAAFLAPLPLDSLPVDAGIAARLAALGLDCVGAVANLSSADLQRQFGLAGKDLWHRARGEDGVGDWPPRPRTGAPGSPVGDLPLVVGGAMGPPRWLGERLILEGGVGDLEALRFAVHRCALELGERLRRDGRRAAMITLVCELDQAEAAELRIAPLQPPGSGAELWPVALELLAGLRLPAPVTAVRLEIEGLQGQVGRQVDLWRHGDAAGEEISGAAARLRARFGSAAVRRAALAVDPGDLPERRFRWAEPGADSGDGGDGGGAQARGVGLRGQQGEVPAPVMPALRR